MFGFLFSTPSLVTPPPSRAVRRPASPLAPSAVRPLQSRRPPSEIARPAVRRPPSAALQSRRPPQGPSHLSRGMPSYLLKRYRSRKGRLAQNVLAICDFDMNFTYVYAGWEGSAADARVLDHAVSQDPTFPFPPIGKYYLVDAGFTNYQCFLAPYRGTRYHLPEWRGQGRRYRTPQDMFNHAHSRLRNVIERAFGVLKKRFPILQWGMPSYLLNHQVDIVIACCTLHNFIRKFSNDDIIFNEPDGDAPQDMDSFYHRGHPTMSEIEEQRNLRDSIAMQMWASQNGT
ncbi:UNVERIFIED_CONTAM: hypothetical protein Sradi_2956200 [Sesamum radiatum]|uniref:DDE Tnp4 domain-containing protein n=1 Tax=Sesamum radiatum TaxID=300843 RepID=A0AAW2RZP1_SESRA